MTKHAVLHRKIGYCFSRKYYFNPEKTQVLVKPDKDAEYSILLAKVSNEEQKFSIGSQTGGQVYYF